MLGIPVKIHFNMFKTVKKKKKKFKYFFLGKNIVGKSHQEHVRYIAS